MSGMLQPSKGEEPEAMTPTMPSTTTTNATAATKEESVTTSQVKRLLFLFNSDPLTRKHFFQIFYNSEAFVSEFKILLEMFP